MKYNFYENFDCKSYQDFDYKGYEKFDYKSYLDINEDLNFNNKKQAWDHWKKYGINEERATSFTNNSKIHNARFGNLFLINMAIHFIACKFNLKFEYKYFQKFNSLGIDFFIGKKTYNKTIFLSDKSFIDVIKYKQRRSNIKIDNNMWCQNADFIFFLKEYFTQINIRLKIINNNIFKNRYNNNNDLFAHIRLGDISNKFNNSFNYYDNIISKTNFKNGYISSDSIDNNICTQLISKYNLNVINYDEVKTIMFASTCNNLILSGGTFSWLIGFLAFYSKFICYPKKKKEDVWYGEIFVFPEWLAIEEID